MKNFPYTTFARGWYQLAWSHEVADGQVVPLAYFGTDLVMYREKEGQLHVSDAHCPHLGSHLGYGGTVEGDCIRCPYHGWAFGPTGENVEIPYSTPERLNVRLNTWDVREVQGLILVWYGAAGPTHEPEPFTDTDVECWDYKDGGTRLWADVKMAPQLFTENLADPAHFRYVHSSDVVPDLMEFHYDEPYMRTRVAFEFGVGAESTWATPNGPQKGAITLRASGLGISISTLYSFDTVWAIQCTTPIDAERSDSRVTIWVPTKRGDGSPLPAEVRDRWYREEFNQHNSDIAIFEHLKYRRRPPLAKVEQQPMMQLREWARGLYEEQPEPAAG